MKKIKPLLFVRQSILFFVVLFVIIVGDSYGEGPIYNLIGKSLADITNEMGCQGTIKPFNAQDTLVMYHSEFGDLGFILHNSKTVFINPKLRIREINRERKSTRFIECVKAIV